jgi:hypothetical protein
VALGRSQLDFAIRGGAFRPLLADSPFGLREWSLAGVVELTPRLAAGTRFALGLGPSWLSVTPDAPLVSRREPNEAALFVDAELSRPFWLGPFAFVPALGARWFTSERGVRLDGVERFALSGVCPRFSLGVAYRLGPAERPR